MSIYITSLLLSASSEPKVDSNWLRSQVSADGSKLYFTAFHTGGLGMGDNARIFLGLQLINVYTNPVFYVTNFSLIFHGTSSLHRHN
jgi:hypothetical protein